MPRLHEIFLDDLHLETQNSLKLLTNLKTFYANRKLSFASHIAQFAFLNNFRHFSSTYCITYKFRHISREYLSAFLHAISGLFFAFFETFSTKVNFCFIQYSQANKVDLKVDFEKKSTFFIESYFYAREVLWNLNYFFFLTK